MKQVHVKIHFHTRIPVWQYMPELWYFVEKRECWKWIFHRMHLLVTIVSLIPPFLIHTKTGYFEKTLMWRLIPFLGVNKMCTNIRLCNSCNFDLVVSLWEGNGNWFAWNLRKCAWVKSSRIYMNVLQTPAKYQPERLYILWIHKCVEKNHTKNSIKFILDVHFVLTLLFPMMISHIRYIFSDLIHMFTYEQHTHIHATLFFFSLVL